MKNLKINENTKKWIYFKIEDIFDDVSIAKSIDLLNLEKNENGINYIGRTRENNGVTAKVLFTEDLISLINKGGCITITMVGNSTCSTFFQKEDFFASQNILILRNKNLNQHNAIFISNVIGLEKYRFSYGRTLTKGFFEKHNIKLPSKNGFPDWQFMEDYIKNIKKDVKDPSSKSLISKKINIDQNSWKSFNLSDLFKIKGSLTTPWLELEEYGNGEYPYVTTQATNNGTEGFYNYYTENGKVLTIDSAVIGYCSYQPYNFSASDHVEKLIPRFEINKYIAMFLVTIINKEQYRYNYGRKCSQDRIEKSNIKLPSKNGFPDWQFMEDYIKTIQYSRSI